jgi:O-succinylbenzoic acid--CoA ligase
VAHLPTITLDEQARLEGALLEGIIVETSGSTEKPKRVVLSAEALRASAEATSAAIGVGGWVLTLPLSYIAGIMVGIRALIAGKSLVDLRAEPFTAEGFVNAVTRIPDGTWFTSLVPTQLARLVDFAESNENGAVALRRFDAILVGGQAIPAGLVDRATALGARVIKTYGSAETAGGVVYNGTPIGDTQLRIAADGVLEIRSSSLASGYLGDEQRTRECFVDGWYRTSDIAHFDDGRLVIDGRVDDIIVTGGVKVSLADIERVLNTAGITAVATWFADEQWGQVPALVSTGTLDLDNVRGVVEAALGKVARPYRIVTVPSIPTLSSGKVDRVALREIVESAQP